MTCWRQGGQAVTQPGSPSGIGGGLGGRRGRWSPQKVAENKVSDQPEVTTRDLEEVADDVLEV